MSAHRPHRIDRDTAERLLRGQRVPDQPELEPLSDLLAAAAAPPTDRALAGEQAAMSAFRAVHLGPVTQRGRPSVSTSLLSKLLTVKIAAAAFAVAAVSGVAVAAVTTVSPPGQNGERSAGVHDTTSAPPTSTAHSHEQVAPAGKPDEHSPGPAATPSPSLVGLCRAYFAGAGSSPGKALDSPAFRSLITAAGGEQNVSGYCASVLPAHGPQGNGVGPQRPTGPQARPSSTHPAPAADKVARHAPTRPTVTPEAAPEQSPQGSQRSGR